MHMYEQIDNNILDGPGLIQQMMESQKEKGSIVLKKILSSSWGQIIDKIKDSQKSLCFTWVFSRQRNFKAIYSKSMSL